jgi:hypothetical protein
MIALLDKTNVSRFEIVDPTLRLEWMRELIVCRSTKTMKKKKGDNTEICLIMDAVIPRILRQIPSFALSFTFHADFACTFEQSQTYQEQVFFLHRENLTQLFPQCRFLKQNLSKPKQT